MNVHLVVNESADKKNLENPGSLAYMEELKGKTAGLPYYAFLNAEGKVLGNALQMPSAKDPEVKTNIGHPFEPKEVDIFMALLRKAAPKMTDAEAKILTDWLKNQKLS